MKTYPLHSFLQLMQIMEHTFLYKLRQKNPDISEESMQEELKKWYMQRPEAEHGDGDGIPGDISRFRT